MNKKSDQELRSFAKELLQVYSSAVARSDEDARRIFRSGRFSLVEGGLVELTDDVINAFSKFANRAAHLLGARLAHEKSIQQIAQKEAQRWCEDGHSIEDGISNLINRVFSEGDATFEFICANHSIQFKDPVREISIGPVRAALTEDIATELEQRRPDGKAKIVPSKDFSFQISDDKVLVGMNSICWIVNVNAAKENIEEEAKWLIDVALSFLRLHYGAGGPLFPHYGTVERHPIIPPNFAENRVKITGDTFSFGGKSLPRLYEVGEHVAEISRQREFQQKAALIFNAPEKSLAMRVKQGLGWLSRGRQSEDRSERLLFFFTAIESLLTDDDKNAPVIQTIARHLSVILTNDLSNRYAISKQLRKLYELRSKLVHAGSRSVLWNSAYRAQALAESLFFTVLREVDLETSRDEFNAQLSKASYGLPWNST